MSENDLRDSIARLPNDALDRVESQFRQARAVCVSKMKGIDEVLRLIRRDRQWREKGN